MPWEKIDTPQPAVHLRRVAENVYTNVLRQAASIEGSTQALATLLRVPEGTLLRWMSGRSQMPLRAFLKAIDLVAKHEVRHAAPPAQPAAATEQLRFNVGPVLARCSGCNGELFRRADPSQRLTYLSMLVCIGCEAEVQHAQLVVQLAREVGQYARQQLAALKKARAQRRNTPCTGNLTSTKEVPDGRQHSRSGQRPAPASAPYPEGT
jgi:hypothetical protein